MTEHPPGPWTQGGTFDPNSDHPTTTIYGPRAEPHHQSGPMIAWRVPLKYAALITASPDLLAALKELAACEHDPKYARQVILAGRAINKAEGRDCGQTGVIDDD